MRVHLIRKQTIEDHVLEHSTSRTGYKIWLGLLKGADWYVPKDIMATFGTADLLGNGSDRVVFNIGGNKYRLICKYVFGRSKVHLFVCWMGTHAEYTKLCDKGDQYRVNKY